MFIKFRQTVYVLSRGSRSRFPNSERCRGNSSFREVWLSLEEREKIFQGFLRPFWPWLLPIRIGIQAVLQNFPRINIYRDVSIEGLRQAIRACTGGKSGKKYFYASNVNLGDDLPCVDKEKKLCPCVIMQLHKKWSSLNMEMTHSERIFSVKVISLLAFPSASQRLFCLLFSHLPTVSFCHAISSERYKFPLTPFTLTCLLNNKWSMLS